MPSLQVKVSYDGALHDDIEQRIESFLRMHNRARGQAAKIATESTRMHWRFNNPAPARPPAAPRKGRPTTRGKLPSLLEWKVTADGMVTFQRRQVEARAPYWIIHEIGTGNKATIRTAGAKNPVGRPKKGSNYVVEVKSQKGRLLPKHLVWSRDRQRYDPTAPSQLFPRRGMSGVPRFDPKRRQYISREIHGRHMVQVGGRMGRNYLHREMTNAFKQVFNHRR